MASRLQLHAISQVQSSVGRTSGLKATTIRWPTRPLNSIQLRSIGHSPLRPLARSQLPASFGRNIPSHSRSFFWRSSAAAAAVTTESAATAAATATTNTPSSVTGTPLSTITSTTETAAPAASTLTGYEIPDFPSSSVTNIPTIPTTVDIGYLHSLGVEYSYFNPANYLEWLLEHVHVYSGMPWWGSITVTVLIVRLGLLKFAITNNEVMTRIAVLAPVTRPLSSEISKATQERKLDLATQKRTELMAINRRMGTTIKDMARFPVIQGLVGFGTFKLLRDMASIPVPGFETGGLLWLTDLSISDPYYVIPLAQFVMMATTMTIVRERAPTGAAMSRRTSQMISIGMATLMSGFTAFMPAGLQIAFFLSAFWQQTINIALTFPSIRALFRLSPMPTTAAGNAAKAPKLEDKLTVVKWQKEGGAGGSQEPVLRATRNSAETAPSFVRGVLDQVDARMVDMGYSKNGDDAKTRSRKRGQEREREWYEKYKDTVKRS